MEESKDIIIKGFEKQIKLLENRKSEYWNGVRDGYITSLEFIQKHEPFKKSTNEEASKN